MATVRMIIKLSTKRLICILKLKLFMQYVSLLECVTSKFKKILSFILKD